MSNFDLFLQAYSGNEPEKAPEGETKVWGDTTRLFETAFGVDDKLKNYTPEPILDYDFEYKKGTDVSKLYMLDAAMKEGTQYRDLPMGLRDLVKPKRPLAKELRREEDETGMKLEERQAAFDALQFGIDYMASLADTGLPASIIATEYQKLKERFPAQAIDELLAETNQQLLAQLKAQAELERFEEQKAAQQKKSAEDEAALKAELETAAQLIAMRNQKETPESLRNALALNNALETRQIED